ncbi:MAG: hypothetical protein RR825_03220, partial [Ruthenibacterium sp.]
YNTIAQLAAEENVPFWDFNARFAETGLVPAEDLADEQHLNIYGNVKFSAYLAEQLRAYNLPDRRGDDKYKSWVRACEREIYVQKW